MKNSTQKRHFHTTFLLLGRHSHQPKVAIKNSTPSPFLGLKETSLVEYPKPSHSKQKYLVRNLPKRLTIQSLRPELPITFPVGIDKDIYYKKQLLSNNPKFYEISLMKSLIGLSAKIKKIANSIGLSRRHQVCYRRISPKTAGQILKLKELVSVRLVEKVGEKQERSLGYKRLGNALVI